MQTINRATYDQLVESAKAKANVFDQTVAIVMWDGGAELVLCPSRGNRNEPDMSKVNLLLETRADSEIVELVGPTY